MTSRVKYASSLKPQSEHELLHLISLTSLGFGPLDACTAERTKPES